MDGRATHIFPLIRIRLSLGIEWAFQLGFFNCAACDGCRKTFCKYVSFPCGQTKTRFCMSKMWGFYPFPSHRLESILCATAFWTYQFSTQKSLRQHEYLSVRLGIGVWKVGFQFSGMHAGGKSVKAQLLFSYFALLYALDAMQFMYAQLFTVCSHTQAAYTILNGVFF